MSGYCFLQIQTSRALRRHSDQQETGYLKPVEVTVAFLFFLLTAPLQTPEVINLGQPVLRRLTGGRGSALLVC